MPDVNPKAQHDHTRRRPWFLVSVICSCVIIALAVIVPTLLIRGNSSNDFEYTQSQLLEEMLGVAHDELIMLIISLVVVIQVVANFKLLKQFPRMPLLLWSFGLVVLSAICTVVESLFWVEVLNYIEHLSFMAASILLAVWCWRVFGSEKQEGS